LVLIESPYVISYLSSIVTIVPVFYISKFCLFSPFLPSQSCLKPSQEGSPVSDLRLQYEIVCHLRDMCLCTRHVESRMILCLLVLTQYRAWQTERQTDGQTDTTLMSIVLIYHRRKFDTEILMPM